MSVARFILNYIGAEHLSQGLVKYLKFCILLNGLIVVFAAFLPSTLGVPLVFGCGDFGHSRGRMGCDRASARTNTLMLGTLYGRGPLLLWEPPSRYRYILESST